MQFIGNEGNLKPASAFWVLSLTYLLPQFFSMKMESIWFLMEEVY